MVLNQDQVNGEEFWRSMEEDFWSSGSSYTGQTTRASLSRVELINIIREQRGWEGVLCMGKHRAPFVEEVVDAELDAALYYPA